MFFNYRYSNNSRLFTSEKCLWFILILYWYLVTKTYLLKCFHDSFLQVLDGCQNAQHLWLASHDALLCVPTMSTQSSVVVSISGRWCTLATMLDLCQSLKMWLIVSRLAAWHGSDRRVLLLLLLFSFWCFCDTFRVYHWKCTNTTRVFAIKKSFVAATSWYLDLKFVLLANTPCGPQGTVSMKCCP